MEKNQKKNTNLGLQMNVYFKTTSKITKLSIRKSILISFTRRETEFLVQFQGEDPKERKISANKIILSSKCLNVVDKKLLSLVRVLLWG